jgi:hypothetical protein
MFITAMVPQSTTVDVICDRYGESCRNECNCEYAAINATWGYGSHKDGEHHTMQLCEKCYDWLLEITKLQPKIDG